jgi:hypothetical protein
MNRRDLITLIGGAAAWPVAARAQQAERMRRIGVLTGFAEDDRTGQGLVAAFWQRLAGLGWVEGRNVRIEVRWAAAGNVALMRTHAMELARLAPEVILVHGSRAWPRCSGRCTRPRSCLPGCPIPSVRDSLQAWLVRAATLPGSQPTRDRVSASSRTCSKRSRPASPAWQ